jgi:hypothetical protein
MESVSLAEAVKVLSCVTRDMFATKGISHVIHSLSDEFIEETPDGFRLSFQERYDALKSLCIDMKLLKEKDFPIIGRKEHVQAIEHKVKTNEYQDKMQIKQLETMLIDLLDMYHLLSLKHENLGKLSEIRKRIHDCRRKIHMLKAKK